MAEYLPGDIRQRIRDLLAERQMSVAELAEKVGCDETTLGRFIRGDTQKIGDQTITRIAGVFYVSTDFLLGVTNIPDRKNYDIEELGLSVAAAKNLYTGKVNPEMVNLLLENDRFAYLITLLARYLDEDLSAGIAAQNQLFNSVSSLLTGYAKTGPEDRQAALETAQTVRSAKQPPTIAGTNALQSVFLQVIHELKRDSASNRQAAQALTKDAAEEVFSNAAQISPVLSVPEMFCPVRRQPLSAADGRKRYNNLDFASQSRVPGGRRPLWIPLQKGVPHPF